MPRIWRNRYAARKFAAQGCRYFEKYGKIAEGFFLVWSLLAVVIILRFLDMRSNLPRKVTSSFQVYRPGEDELMWESLIIPLIVVTIIWIIGEIFLIRRAKALRRDRMNALMSKNSDVTPEEFLAKRMWSAINGEEGDFTGIYVLHNLSQDEYYVGQSVHVLRRVRQHFTGHGNGDVYADWKMGDKFTIATVSLVGSGYNNLNDLERDVICAYDAYDHGYNRTSGNRS
ncbi:hypothetical protein HMPREF1527_01403 [Atopobium sp. oral taxon 199 str. F0494]|nr:hypothetical protein HMPREF1527_01403 [Atopobium sp. oral taxon 199 str. F0494]